MVLSVPEDRTVWSAISLVSSSWGQGTKDDVCLLLCPRRENVAQVEPQRDVADGDSCQGCRKRKGSTHESVDDKKAAGISRGLQKREENWYQE